MFARFVWQLSLGENPKLRLLIVAHGDAYAARLAGFVRDIMNTPWYRQTFATRIKTGHDRINDFQTTAGGGIYAAGAQGAITGYPADVIIYDDPHQLNECNNEKALYAVKDNFSNVLSRMQNKLKGRIIVVAHRVSTEDLSADLISEPDWKCTTCSGGSYETYIRAWPCLVGTATRRYSSSERLFEGRY